jgi:colanic acid biosynthesis protein WcaH
MTDQVASAAIMPDTERGHEARALELPAGEFAAAAAALPLVSVDWVLANPDGQLLLGQRINAPARGWWFTPGGRIRKNEALVQAMLRVGRDELGLAPDACRKLLGKARLMGAWDHFYADSAFNASLSTHYVNLPHWLALTWDEVALLKLPVGEQHSAWQWLPLVNAAQNPLVHPHVQPYAAWGLGVSPAAA